MLSENILINFILISLGEEEDEEEDEEGRQGTRVQCNQ